MREERHKAHYVGVCDGGDERGRYLRAGRSVISVERKCYITITHLRLWLD